MRTSLLLFLLLSILIKPGYTQDLIITNEGDSINCNITKVKKDYVYFTFMHENEIQKTLLPDSNIKYRQFDFHQTNKLKTDTLSEKKDYQNIRIGLSAGYSYHIAKVHEDVPSDFEDYTRKLKSGLNLGVDITYFFTEYIGAGIKYNRFTTSNSMDNVYIEDINGNRRYGTMSDDILINFIGPMLSTRLLNYDKTNAFYMNLALGYIGYTNDKVLVDDYQITGNTIGLSYDIGYKIGLNENISFNFQLTFVSGSLTEYVIDEGIQEKTIKLEEGEYESLHRIDISAGLSFSI
jgi:opacity protein-like surface antigen